MQIKFKHFFFQECKRCGERLKLSVSRFDSDLQIVDPRIDKCLGCWEENFDLQKWEIICITSKEEIAD